MSGVTLTLSAVVAGTATVTVTASDVKDLTARQTFGVTVGDRLVRGVMTDALAALGRGHLSSARLAIGRRLETGGAGMTRLMVAGQYLSLDAWDRMGAGGLEQSHELLFRAATLQQRRSATDLVGTSADPRLRRPGAAGLMGGGLGGPGGSRGPAAAGDRRAVVVRRARDAVGRWPRRAVDRVGAGRPAVVPRCADRDVELRRRPADGLSGGRHAAERAVAGSVAVARSGGTGNWQMGSSSGRLATELTVLHPYVRWAVGKRPCGRWPGWAGARPRTCGS